MEEVSVGVIGAGYWANQTHYPSLSSFDDVKIVSICDLIEEKMSKTAERYCVESLYSDYKKMVSKEDLDCVYIIMPPHQVYGPIIHCLKNKLNVFIEKPPGVTYEQTKNMYLTAEKNGCITMVGLNRRYAPLARKVKALVEKRGQIIQCMTSYYKNYTDETSYYDGAIDILTCDAIHAVDTLRWMGGKPESIASNISQYYTKYNNSFNALIRFENGAVGFLITNWIVGKRVYTLEMHAKGISAFINPDEKAVIYSDNNDEPKTITAKEAVGSSEYIKYYGFYAENRHFIDCIKTNVEPETSFKDAVKTMELVKRIYNSQIC